MVMTWEVEGLLPLSQAQPVVLVNVLLVPSNGNQFIVA